MRLILSRIFWYCGRKIFASCELGRVARTMSALSLGNSGVASKVLRTMELMESWWRGGSAELGIQGVQTSVLRASDLGVRASANWSRGERLFLGLVSDKTLGL